MKELILFRNFYKEDILKGFAGLAENTPKSSGESAAELTSRLLKLSLSYGFEGNIWHCFLTLLLILNENPFTLASEGRGRINGTLREAALRDCGVLRELFSLDLNEIGKNWGSFIPETLLSFKNDPSCNMGEILDEEVRERIISLSKRLAAADNEEDFLKELEGFYKEQGVGKFGLHRAFRLKVREGKGAFAEPITRLKKVSLDDIVGMEAQKKKLTDNTEAFIEGRKANNVLLFGDAGTGKSTCIKGILNKYGSRGLRMIEIYKHQYRELTEVIREIKNRNYRFIICMDDLSFEDSEFEYKNLKAIMEGGLEKRPDNVLIYATSNRRHLIHEGFSDRLDRKDTDDIHESDTVQEKLSLSARFGEKIYFGRPNKKEFDHIVTELSKRRGLDIDTEKLLYEANKWELSHGGMSGRTAEQFIDYLEGVNRL